MRNRLIQFITISTLSLSMLAFTACESSSTTGTDDPDPSIVDIATGNDDFTSLVSALTDAGLVTTLQGDGPFTVFAPTNDAFDALPDGVLSSLTNEQLQDILLYHVLGAEVFAGDLTAEQTVTVANNQEVFITRNGANVTINGSATVSTADLDASNGVVHVIDSVILPDAFGNVVANASKRYFLSTLVDLLVQQDLAGALQAEGPFTVFAPTDEAFEAIADVLPTLTSEQITEVLLYHVIETRVLSGDLQPTQEVPTLNGQTVTVTVENGVVSINGEATVESADADGTNGVIHVIDSVLLPPSE